MVALGPSLLCLTLAQSQSYQRYSYLCKLVPLTTTLVQTSSLSRSPWSSLRVHSHFHSYPQDRTGTCPAGYYTAVLFVLVTMTLWVGVHVCISVGVLARATVGVWL